MEAHAFELLFFMFYQKYYRRFAIVLYKIAKRNVYKVFYGLSEVLLMFRIEISRRRGSSGEDTS